MKQITIADKSFYIEYNMLAMLQMEETIGRADFVTKKLKDKDRGRFLFKLVSILAAACGEDVDEKWLIDNVKPAYYLTLHLAVLDEMARGMDIQGDPSEEVKVVDVGLREIKKKMGAL